MKKITKNDLIGEIAKSTGAQTKHCKTLVEEFLNKIEENISKGNDVQLLGFGSFSVKKVAARKGINPRTREELKIPATKRIKFTPSSRLKELAAKSK